MGISGEGQVLDHVGGVRGWQRFAAAHGLGKQTVAEYVGDAATLEMVGRLGVDYAQGYHLGHPANLPAPAVPAQRGAPAPRPG